MTTSQKSQADIDTQDAALLKRVLAVLTEPQNSTIFGKVAALLSSDTRAALIARAASAEPYTSADASLFRGVMLTLLVETNRPLLTQVMGAFSPGLTTPLLVRGAQLLSTPAAAPAASTVKT